MKAEKMPSKESTVSRLPRCIVSILFTGVILTGGFIFFVAFTSGAPEVATAKMVFGLIVLWVVLGGTLMYHFREQVRQCIQRLPVDWRVKFVLFATLLALMEEAIAVLMTNSAPFLGVKVGEAYITASTNFIDLVLFHSVVVFVPLFIAWAVLLWRYDFSPFAVFLLFGLTGVVCEATINPVGALVGFAMWIFIYGLMIYLPAYCIPTTRAAQTAKWYHHLLAIPATFLIALPLLIPIMYVLR
ncbi:MAG: hypothetical protein P8K78_07375 [Pirellulales bacterium]|nr:hypothetical protein [Pirellulales bacterium]